MLMLVLVVIWECFIFKIYEILIINVTFLVNKYY